jgi:TatD DNase family protein
LEALVDSHCHLFSNLFADDFDEVLSHAWENGITRILMPGIDLETSEQVVALSERYPNLYAAVGVHPNDAQGWQKDSQARLGSLAAHPKVVAIGEIGLDYYRNHAPQALQRKILEAQLELAADLRKPVVIHNRQAFTDLWPILKDWQAGLAQTHNPLSQAAGVLHSFEGDLPSALMATGLKFHIGIGGPVTFRNALVSQEVAKGIALEDILLETDAPFLTPHPHRGQRNEPSYVIFIAKKISELRAQSLDVVAEVTTQNANRLFAWGAAA